MTELLKVLIPVALVHAVALAVFLLIIRQAVRHQTQRAISAIRQVEAEIRKKEEGIVRRIQEHEEEFARRKAEADAELQKRKQEAERDVHQLRDKILREANAESEKILQKARETEGALRKQILQEAEQQAVRYAGELFRLVFSERMTAEVNRQFLDELLDALEDVDASSITVDPTQAEFRSSTPLPPEQKARLRQLLREKFQADIPIEEKVDESLLGGLAFKLGSLEIDGTLRTRYQEALEEVRKLVSS